MNTDRHRAYIEHGSCLYEFDGIEFIYCYTTENGDRYEKKKDLKISSYQHRIIPCDLAM